MCVCIRLCMCVYFVESVFSFLMLSLKMNENIKYTTSLTDHTHNLAHKHARPPAVWVLNPVMEFSLYRHTYAPGHPG